MPSGAAREVDQVQYSVAKPSASPPASRAISCTPRARRIGDQRPRQREQPLVGRAHRVEVAVAAHQRQQLGEVLLAGDRDGRRPVGVATVPAGVIVVGHGLRLMQPPAAADPYADEPPIGIPSPSPPRSRQPPGARRRSGCGSGQATLDPIAQAADVTTHSGGSQIAMTIAASKCQAWPPRSR